MSERFSNLTKIPREPAARMLAVANAKLATEIKSPASAPVEDVLAELDSAGAVFDMLRLLAVALPPRERTWWSCLAGRDLLEDPATSKPPAPLAAAEAWVFKPTDENRETARLAMESADADDDTSLCALTVAMCDGKLGTGDLAEFDAPPGGSEIAAFGINMAALSHRSDNFEAHGQLLIDRAIDIARGGSGKPKERN
jgi:hypothetical protein